MKKKKLVKPIAEKIKKTPGKKAALELSMPLLPLRDLVVFPHMAIPLYVGRQKSILAVEQAMQQKRILFLCSQKKAKTNDPTPADMHSIGTVGEIMQHIKRPDGTIKIVVEGARRGRIIDFIQQEPFMAVRVEPMSEMVVQPAEQQALQRTIQDVFEEYVRLSRRLQPETVGTIRAIEEPGRLADTIIAHLPIKHSDKQSMLEMDAPRHRLERLYELMQGEIEILQVERKIRSRVKKQMERTEKEYYLNEQMRAIQKELGERDEFKNEIQELSDKLKSKEMTADCAQKVEKEIKKLKMMSPMSAEATVVRNYIDWCLALPWLVMTPSKLDIAVAKSILEEEHYGLKVVKERILEYLAVHTLVEKMRGPILCLVGPPGVGKTSLARAIARATGRQFVRQSLGGVRDEAEIRGHRRTYIGAMPGKIIQSLKRVGASNPVFLLDEIDKLNMDNRGDPAAALLELLDPEQNNAFSDHYLDMDYDCSRIMFICTANSTHNIPPALEDRLEIIRIAGYTEQEKIRISKRYLIPKEQKENGITSLDLQWPIASIVRIVRQYTREPGVRSLQRNIATICRKLAKALVQKKIKDSFEITPKRVRQFLGVPEFRASKREKQAEVGLSTGLAWTTAGGEILRIEACIVPGKGKLVLTGKLGDVMQESIKAALTYVRSRAELLNLSPHFNEHIDIHIHVPEGAIPKDGPSAGITMATALVSSLTGIPVRCDVAMTGEITTRGNVIAIGGLKEKVLAAQQARIDRVILPKENQKDLSEIPKEIAKKMTFVLVEHMHEVLDAALLTPLPKKKVSRKSVASGRKKVIAKKKVAKRKQRTTASSSRRRAHFDGSLT